jgi:hypothetical protein
MPKLSTRHLTIAYRGLAAAPGIAGKLRFLRHAAARSVYLLIRDELARPALPGGGHGADQVLTDAITIAADIETMQARRIPARVAQHAPPRINFLIPLLSPSEFFGGYLAYAMFARVLQRAGARIRFIATDALDGDKAALVEACKTHFPAMAQVFAAGDVESAVGPATSPLAFSPSDLIVAFNCAGAAMADKLTREIAPSGRFVFFIQDEEGIFHSNDSYRAWKQAQYRLDHVPVFNSDWLRDHFVQAGFGPAARGEPHAWFRHALETPGPPDAAELDARQQRKLLFFARPERNTARNLFELGLLALKGAIARGGFPPDSWRLHAIGAKAYPPISLGGGRKLEFIGKLPFDAYVRALPNYDAGMVLMFSPHPSVPNLELAAAGVPTLTTSYSNRPAATMQAAAPNLVVREAALPDLIEGLQEVERRSLVGARRVADAGFSWPRGWDESFSPAWIAAFRKTLRESGAMSPEAEAALFGRAP